MAQLRLYYLSKPNLYRTNEKMFAGTLPNQGIRATKYEFQRMGVHLLHKKVG